MPCIVLVLGLSSYFLPYQFNMHFFKEGTDAITTKWIINTEISFGAASVSRDWFIFDDCLLEQKKTILWNMVQ